MILDPLDHLDPGSPKKVGVVPPPIIELYIPTVTPFLVERECLLKVRLEVRFVQTQPIVLKPQPDVLFPGFDDGVPGHQADYRRVSISWLPFHSNTRSQCSMLVLFSQDNPEDVMTRRNRFSLVRNTFTS